LSRVFSMVVEEGDGKEDSVYLSQESREHS
jgi:hypothetical protein